MARRKAADPGAAEARPDPALALTRLFELAARSLHSAGYSQGLFPAQWTTLRYLAYAPKMARTATDLARFQQIAIGPVTRTIRTLITKGLVAKAGTGPHHRSALLALTPEGVAMLAHDPLKRVNDIFRRLTPADRETVADMLGAIAFALHNGEATDGDMVLTPDET